jgi:hypothetical protein
MVKPAFEALSSTIQYASAFFPPGLVISLAAANIEGGKYWKVYKAEFVGTMLMIVCTFSAGKWWGADSLPIAWTMHALGVICADYFGGGPHVNVSENKKKETSLLESCHPCRLMAQLYFTFF